MSGSRASSTGVDQPDRVRVADQMATSGWPSLVPPNQAANRSPFFSSTMADAWLEAKGAEPTGKISSRDGWAVAMEAKSERSRAATRESAGTVPPGRDLKQTFERQVPVRRTHSQIPTKGPGPRNY